MRKKKMKGFLSLFAALLLLQSLSLVDSSFEETCKKFNGPTVDYNFCVTSLQVNSESNKVDTEGLAIIATKLAKANFMHNLAKTKELLKSKELSPFVKQVLEVCSELYDDGVDVLEQAIGYIKSKDIESARVQFSASLIDVDTCMDTWEEGSEKSLLLKENEDAERIGTLAFEIAILLE